MTVLLLVTRSSIALDVLPGWLYSTACSPASLDHKMCIVMHRVVHMMSNSNGVCSTHMYGCLRLLAISLTLQYLQLCPGVDTQGMQIALACQAKLTDTTSRNNSFVQHVGRYEHHFTVPCLPKLETWLEIFPQSIARQTPIARQALSNIQRLHSTKLFTAAEMQRLAQYSSHLTHLS